MKKNLTKIVVVFMALICSFVLSASVFASTQDFYIEDFTADYYLTTTEDGTSKLHVKEVITAVFPETDQNHGITRTIPFLNQAGKNRTVKDRAALGFSALRNGEVENVAKVSEDNSVFTIYLGKSSEYVHGRQVYTLEYDFTNVIVDFDADGNNVSGKSGVAQAFQELYWDTNGTGWSQKFGKVTANLHLDAAIMPKIRPETWCYVGGYGETGSERCVVSKTDDGFAFATADLSAGENLTFVVQFEPNTFVVPVERTYILVWALVIVAVICTAILIRKIVRWRRTAKPAHDVYRATFVAPQYLPPEDNSVRVAEAEQLYLKGTKKSYVATLLELAVAKQVSIFKTNDAKHPKKKVWVVKLNVNATELSPSQRRMVEILNGGITPSMGEEVIIKKRKASQRSADCVRWYRSEARTVLKRHGYIDDKYQPTSRANSIIKFVLIMLVVPFMAYSALIGYRMITVIDLINRWESLDVVGETFIPPLIGVILVVTVVAVIALNTLTQKYALYTDDGVKMVRYLEGLELYIKMAERDRLKFLQSVEGADTTKEGLVKLYEKLLPWASLFGAEESWLKELGKYYEVEDVRPSFDVDFFDGFASGAITSGVMQSVYSSSSYHAPSSGGFSRGGWSSSDSGGSGSSSSSGGGSSGGSGGGGGGGGGGGW